MDKFVLIPKKGETNLFCLLPLILQLNSQYENIEFNIIHTLDLSNQLGFLDLNVRYFTVSEKDYGPVSSIKLAAKFHDLFNITHALVFREEVGVLQFVKSLKAKTRIGWKSLVNEVFLTEAVPKAGEADYLVFWEKSKSLKGESDKLSDQVLSLDSRTPENFFKDQNSTPFVFLSCESFSNDEVVIKLCNDLAPALKEHRLIIWSREESELLKELTSRYKNVVDASSAEEGLLYRYVNKCMAFMSTIEWHSHMACYLGVIPKYIGVSRPESFETFKYSTDWIKDNTDGTFSHFPEGENENVNLDELVNIVLREVES